VFNDENGWCDCAEDYLYYVPVEVADFVPEGYAYPAICSTVHPDF